MEQLKAQEETATISCYCKEVLGFMWVLFLVHFGNITWSTADEHSQNNESVLKTPMNNEYMQQSLGSRAIFHRLYTAFHSFGFGRVVGKENFSVSIFHFFFLFGCCIFLTAFSVQLVNSSLTHDVPWMLLRTLSLIFHYFFFDQEMREN